jgi:hypothetical protein
MIAISIFSDSDQAFQGCPAYCFWIGGEGGDDEEEDERGDELHDERPRGAERRHGSDGSSEVRRIVVNRLGRERGDRGAEELGGDVRRELGPGEVAERGHGGADRRVQVGAGDVGQRRHDHRHGGPRRRGDAERAQRAAVRLVHDERREQDEDEQEGPQELRRHLLGDESRRRPLLRTRSWMGSLAVHPLGQVVVGGRLREDRRRMRDDDCDLVVAHAVHGSCPRDAQCQIHGDTPQMLH